MNTDPADGAPSISIQTFKSGSSLMARCKNSCARQIVYGGGKRSRTASQILRLFACFASDSASSARHGRMVHRSSVSCIDYLLFELNTGLLHLTIRQQPYQ